MDKFIVNIIHRPEMVPEYAEKVTGHGKEEDISRENLLTESLDIFRTQQEIAHKNGLIALGKGNLSAFARVIRQSCRSVGVV